MLQFSLNWAVVYINKFRSLVNLQNPQPRFPNNNSRIVANRIAARKLSSQKAPHTGRDCTFFTTCPCIYMFSSVVEAQWRHGWCDGLRSGRSGFEPWPGTLCCVLRQDTLLSCTVPLSTQVYKWVLAHLMLEVTL